MSRRGAGLDLDVSHRRLIDVGSQVRPLDDGLFFERIGGQLTVDRLVDVLYDRFEDDPLLRPFFGRDIAKGRARQKRFFAEWLGGPERYSESAWGGLHQHHEDLPITEAAAVRWLDHLQSAVTAAAGEPAPGRRRLQTARPHHRPLLHPPGPPGHGPPAP